MAWPLDEVTQFKGTLLPAGAGGRRAVLPPNRDTPGGLIMRALDPLHAELDALLARDDRQAALRLAHNALAQVADALATYRGDALHPGQVRIHALLVELDPLPLEPQPDGTLAERGTTVNISYRNWSVARGQVSLYARTLTERLQALWPGAWLVLAPTPGPNEGLGEGGGT